MTEDKIDEEAEREVTIYALSGYVASMNASLRDMWSEPITSEWKQRRDTATALLRRLRWESDQAALAEPDQ